MNYKGDVLQTLPNVSVSACCSACSALQSCNTFAYCNRSNGCRNANIDVHPYQECNLKNQAGLATGGSVQYYAAGPDVDWTSGRVLK